MDLKGWVSPIYSEIKSRFGSKSLLGIVIIFIPLASVLFLFHDAILNPPTYGSIFVDSPEIYTRERLVNDRFLQDAWLSRQLESLERDQALSTMARSDIQQSLTMQANANPAARKATESEEGKAGAKSGAEAGAVLPAQSWRSPRDRLIDLADSRDQIRNLLIENQLDDRHDLSGNALYRLKFDTTIIPGRNTLANAKVQVVLSGPVTPTDKELPSPGAWPEDSPWRIIYVKWLNSLSIRLNQTHKELKQVYFSNEFSHNDYANLIEFISTNQNIAARNLRACPSPLIEILGPSDRLLQLKPQDHIARKRCVNSILEEKFDLDTRKARGASNAGGNYVVSKPNTTVASQIVATPADLSQANMRAQAVAHQLDRWLNSFFANKAMQLVLGIVLPESAFAGNNYVSIPALEPLTNLSFFNPVFDAQDGNVFRVAQKMFVVDAIDPQKMPKAEFDKLSTNDPASILYQRDYSDFKIIATDSLSKNELRVSESNLKPPQAEGVSVLSLKFKEDPYIKGRYTALVEVGLTNFVRKARKSTRAFTYAVTPKENSDATLTSQEIDNAVGGGADVPIAGNQRLDFNAHKRAVEATINREGRVVGFGSLQRGEHAAMFGWAIGPRRLISSGSRLTHVQSPAQYSMSALVSIPSWWDTIDLEIVTAWLSEDGTQRNDKPIRYTVQVPTDFEPLEATLLESQQLGPELMESRLDPVFLTACHQGAIVIPGRRLWRSTVVTVGYQAANEISVLPNMKGILAKFKPVQNQISEREYMKARQDKLGFVEIDRPVRVWTSQGTLALPMPARIGIPADCSRDEKP